MQDTATQAESLTDEPDTDTLPEQDQRTVAERKADRMAILSPLGQAIEGRPIGSPRTELPPVWVDQLTRPGLDYDPKNITELPEYEAHAGYVPEVVGALEAMRDALAVVIDAREKVKKDPTLTQAAMALAVADYADGKMPTATRKLDAAMKVMDARIAEAEASLRIGIAGSATGSMASEVRAHVKAMKNGAERMKFMRGLIDSGDTESVAAVLKAKPFLSGLSDAEANLLLHDVNVAARPELPARIAFMKQARDHLERTSAPFILHMQRAVGVRAETVQRLRAAKKAAAIN